MMDKPQIITHIQKSVLHNIFNVKWVPCSAKFVLLGGHSCGSGAISVYELCHTDATPLVEVKKQTAFRCGTFGASSIEDRYFATGDFDGRLEMWNLEDLETPVYSIKAHSKIINAIDGIGGMNSSLGAPEIVTASRDGSVKVWDTRQERLVATMEPAPGDPRQDCWAVAFGQAPGSAEQLVCAGYDNGDIRLFDLRMMSLRWETNIQHGVCCVEFDRKDADMSKLVATTLESKIHVYTMQNHDFKKCTSLVSEKAHKSTVWTVNHLPQDTDVFLTSGGNGSLCLWKHKSPEALSQLQGTTISQQPVTSFDWSPDKKGLSVCTSFDKTVRVLIVTNI